MPELPREQSLESRTRSFGTKRSATTTSKNNRPRKRRRNVVDNNIKLSHSPNHNLATQSSHVEVEKVASFQESVSEVEQSTNMANPNFGRNRLAMGFTKPKADRQDSQSTGEINMSDANSMPGQSSASPIEISDDEMEDSEGGIVINLDQQSVSSHSFSSEESLSEESGEIVSTPGESTPIHEESSALFMVDSKPTTKVKRLSDLSVDELEEQLRYAFFYLDRAQIDLNRPVFCIGCSTEGHLQQDCEAYEVDKFPILKTDGGLKLWISCCVCASRTHLVGDCPQSEQIAEKWSLTNFDPKHIVNLSLETSTMRLEVEAGIRNMRPPGLSIKGRAGLHHAGASRNLDISEDEDEPFLRDPVNRRQDQNRGIARSSQRYDRFNPPPTDAQYRGGGQWYATDSFGRHRSRSRSPDDRTDRYRPREDFGRSRMSPERERDSWRPPPPNEQRHQSQSGKQTSQRDKQNVNGHGPNFRFSLSSRKGANDWSQPSQSGTSTPTGNGGRSAPNQPSRKQNKKNRKNRGGRN